MRRGQVTGGVDEIPGGGGDGVNVEYTTPSRSDRAASVRYYAAARYGGDRAAGAGFRYVGRAGDNEPRWKNVGEVEGDG